MRAVLCVGVCATLTSMTLGGAPLVIDFETDDGGNVLTNGQQIDPGQEFGNFVNIDSATPSGLATIFDSTPGGPNQDTGDNDLLVDLGNILIVQNDQMLTQSNPGFYDNPNDEPSGGSLVFDFMDPSLLLDVILVDVNGNRNIDLFLTDINGLVRTYNVPQQWSNDVEVAPVGYDTLDLTSLLPQDGEGAGGPATGFEDFGFDQNSVVSLEIEFFGSAAMDRLRFIPTPGTLSILAIGLVGTTRRRR